MHHIFTLILALTLAAACGSNSQLAEVKDSSAAARLLAPLPTSARLEVTEDLTIFAGQQASIENNGLVCRVFAVPATSGQDINLKKGSKLKIISAAKHRLVASTNDSNDWRDMSIFEKFDDVGVYVNGPGLHDNVIGMSQFAGKSLYLYFLFKAGTIWYVEYLNAYNADAISWAELYVELAPEQNGYVQCYALREWHVAAETLGWQVFQTPNIVEFAASTPFKVVVPQ